MALQAIGGTPKTVPDFPMFGSSVFSSILLDASAEKASFIFRVPQTGTIDKVGFRVGTVTTADTLRVGLQTVDATTGFATGTAYGGMVAGTQATPASNTFYEVTLGTSATATEDDFVAVVIEYNSFVAGNLNINYVGTRAIVDNYPYSALFTASWAALTDSIPNVTLHYTTGTAYPWTGAYAYSAISVNTTVIRSDTTPDEIGTRIYLPYKCRAYGLAHTCRQNGDCDYVLYEGPVGSATQIAIVSHDKDVLGGAGAHRQTKDFFTTPIDLAANTEYFVCIKPTTTTANSAIMASFDVQTAAMLDQHSGGQQCYHVERTDGGTFTTTTTRRSMISLLIDKLDDGAGGAGAGNPNGLVGAMAL